ncbi:MAG TPA: DJ-1/PfpI family protein [Aquabacterium sp.]|uniref:DJ-1/PfpI family protein n=1 Tax=Aquabacterium sp. TaxID=1872578 RepID=UPI002E308DE9|nr:DJ-1/PfpI family protein [Aquabacterium sp.]HEX5354830.1 DJ-1/PfpI family protein [Aquabacterium sp.]
MTHIGLLLFPQLTVLDLIGPYEVFCRLPDARVDLIWHSLDPVITEHGLPLTPTLRCDEVAKLDVLCVPGGYGVTPLLNDRPTIDFIRRAGAQASYVTSVCSGALLLGAAGLLQGRRATTHWMSLAMLRELGAVPTDARIVHDGKVITGGGVTAGIDFALYLAAQLRGQDVAESIQLAIEYNPDPPFDAGHPSRARTELVAQLRHRARDAQTRRAALLSQAAQGLLQTGGMRVGATTGLTS